ncbi:hypothetical protein BKA59DRAFT_408852, partial [Fusarium tricinctum]
NYSQDIINYVLNNNLNLLNTLDTLINLYSNIINLTLINILLAKAIIKDYFITSSNYFIFNLTLLNVKPALN